MTICDGVSTAKIGVLKTLTQPSSGNGFTIYVPGFGCSTVTSLTGSDGVITYTFTTLAEQNQFWYGRPNESSTEGCRLCKLTPFTSTTTSTTTSGPTTTSTSTTSTSTSTTSTSTTTQGPTTTTTAGPVVTDGLVTWNSCNTFVINSNQWPDSSGNGNSATIFGSQMYASGSLGIAFNGTDNYLQYVQPLTNQPTNNWTMQFFGTLFNDGISRDLFCKVDYTNGWDSIWNPVLPAGRLFVFRDVAGNDKTRAFTNVTAVKQLITMTVNDSTNTVVL
jgi:hypothetical protein